MQQILLSTEIGNFHPIIILIRNIKFPGNAISLTSSPILTFRSTSTTSLYPFKKHSPHVPTYSKKCSFSLHVIFFLIFLEKASIIEIGYLISSFFPILPPPSHFMYQNKQSLVASFLSEIYDTPFEL